MRWGIRLPVVAAAVLLGAAGCGGADRPVVIGSKNFTEQIVLAELLAQHLEDRGIPVRRRPNLGMTFICHRAIVAGEIDLYVEYSGTALTAILEEPPGRDPEAVLDRVREEYARRFDLVVMDRLGFNNTFAIVVRGEDARRHGLRAISDLAPVTPRWRAGFGYEFMERADGFAGLASVYGLRFGDPPRTMELGLLYRALIEKQVDVVAGNSTDGVIAALDLLALEDDRRYFPPYDAAVVVRRSALDAHPTLRQALQALAGRIPEDAMRRLNQAVDGEKREVTTVVREFRRAAGL